MKQRSITWALGSISALCLMLFSANSLVASTSEKKLMKVLYEFSGDSPASAWGTVNDGVMGGLSQGGATLGSEGMVFNGVLSLENNGGFSMAQSNVDLDLSEYKGIRLKVKGDGRTYQLRFESDARLWGMWPVSFNREFETIPGEWAEVFIPFEGLNQSWRGRQLSDHTFNPDRIQQIAILLGDKKEGPFNLEVAWIAAE
ncbi:MAG: CIA30 family protein [Verrucomicrobiota bacterium]